MTLPDRQRHSDPDGFQRAKTGMEAAVPPSRLNSGPRLIRASIREPRQTPLALWHLLSLDAPSVAAVWTIFVALSSGVRLPWTAPAAMFLAVWIIYAADRLLDARLLDDQAIAGQRDAGCSITAGFPAELEARHRFHHRHRSRFFAAILGATAALLYLLHRIDPHSLELYVLLATLLGVWMLLIHGRPLSSGEARRLPKELAVGIFFPAAVFIPTVARVPSLRPVLLAAAALFACVCTLNCLYLYAWEHAEDRRKSASPSAHSTTLWAVHRLPWIAGSIVAAAASAAAVSLLRGVPEVAFPALACALSAACLLVLNARRSRIAAVHLRAFADLVLLTPLLFLPWLVVLPR